ncbi:MAG: sensor histidine kinase [Actinomycetales bacterium]
MPDPSKPTKAEALVAAGFVLAALVEAFVLHHGSPGLLAFTVAGAPLLAVLAVRRLHPFATLLVIAAFSAVGTTIQSLYWRDSGNGGGVWLFALMLAAYSVGGFGRGRRVVLGALLPLLTALAIDLPTMSGWQLVSGVVFVTAFVGALPTLVGTAVRARRTRLAVLAEQRELILHEQQAQREDAVLRERLRASERLQPSLLAGLRDLAEQAESGADPGGIEHDARQLLARTREEVLALAAPFGEDEPVEPPPVDYRTALRVAGQRWTVLAAGGLAAGLAVESTGTLSLRSSAPLAVVASLLVAAPMAFVAWRPLPAVAVTWLLAAGYSRLVAPLDGSLSGAALALLAAGVVGALCGRREAVAGLALCLVGQVIGEGVRDPVGVGAAMTVSWVGGVVFNEATCLVEQSRANNRLLAGHDALVRKRAVMEERLRLARELHDQIGHSLTVVALQAGAARRLAASDPDRVALVMGTIASAAREGLTVLGDRPLDDLEGAVSVLLDRAGAAGLDVHAELPALSGRALQGPVEREAAYRVIQEALTNVLRHAPGSTVEITAVQVGTEVVITVRNTAADAGSGGGSGRGLPGLCERVAACEGELRWGPVEGGGFEVQAVLPALAETVLEGSAG